MDAGGFMGATMAMINKRRQDPAAWFALPYPVQYQALGGDATKLAPKDLMDQGVDTLLNSIGIPAELFKGSLTLQSAPTALRLFESTWATLPHNLNGWLRFVTKRIAQIMGWEQINARMKPVTYADDVQKQMAKLQLMMGGQISNTTGLASVNLNYKDEVDRQMEDQKIQAKAQAKLQEQMDHAATMDQMAQPPQQGQPGQPGQQPQGGGQQPQGGGQPAQGGDPSQQGGGAVQNANEDVLADMPQGPNQKITPEELDSRAQRIVSRIQAMTETQKDSTLIRLKKMNPTLHAIVTQKLKEAKQKQNQQGGDMLRQQQGGGKQASIVLGTKADLEYLDKVSIMRHRRGRIKN
jgi:hypothetical protein